MRRQAPICLRRVLFGSGQAPAGSRRESGHALLLALLVLFLMAVALDLLGSSLLIKMRLIREESRTLHLITLSDAALAEALAGLSADPGFPGFADHPYANGIIGSSIVPAGLNRYVVTAQASYRDGQRAVLANVLLAADGPHVLAWRRIPWSALPP